MLSTAAIGAEKVIPAMQRSEMCDVVAIASRDASRAWEVAQALGIAHAYGSYEELLADPDIDAVYNPLPNHLHAEWTLRAAEAGKHVLCEKPLAMDAAEAERVVEGCRRAGVSLMEAFMYRLHPQWVRVRGLVDQGRLGDLMAIQSWFSFRDVDPASICNVVEFGGGALMDIGCYPINVSRMMFGAEPDRVEAVMHRDQAFGTDVLVSAAMTFGNRQSTFTCSTVLESDQRVHLIGTEGRLLVEIPFNPPPDRATRLLLTVGEDTSEGLNTEVIEIPAKDQYGVQGDLFSRAIIEGTQVPTPPEDAVGNMRLIDAIRSAAGSTPP